MLRKRHLSVIIAIILLWFTACQPKVSHIDSPIITLQPAPITTQPGETPAPESSLTATQHGVTVILTNLEVSSTQTILDFVAQVDTVWGFTFAQYDNPAQDVRIDQLPSLVDETGHIYQVREYQSGVGTKRYVDPQIGIAYTGGRFIFEPIRGSHLEIAISITLQTVQTSQPVRFTVANPNQTQSLSIDPSLIFGELSTRVKAAEWKNAGNFELTVDGSIQENDLRPVCLYLYQDPHFPPASYKGCAYQEGAPIDLTEALTFNPLPDFSQPVEVRVAADIVFLEPFRFTWIRSQQ